MVSLIFFMKKRFIYSLIVIVALALGVSFKQNTAIHADDTRVVTVHIDGETRTIATNAETVKAVLERMGTEIGEHDKTEPSLSQEVRGTDFTINVYRARPIAVVDGANNYTVMTAERAPREIAEDAGFETKPEDQFNFERSDDPFSGAPGTQMVIKRAKTITFDLYGTSSALSTNENTVSDLLKEKGVSLEDGDELNVPKESRITEGMTVSIAKVGRAVETVEEPAAFPEEQIKDAGQPTTYKKIQTPGKNGKKLVTYEIVSINGGTPERKVVKEVITEEPIKQVVIVGVKPFNGNVSADKQAIMLAAGISESDFQYVDYIIGRESGWRVNATNGRTWGLCQALPGSKMSSAGADWETNPITQMRWCNGYAIGRYGSWAGAYSAWLKQHWW